MNEELQIAKERLKNYADTAKWLEGKASGLMMLFGKISADADEVIDKHYQRVLESIDDTYKKIRECEQTIKKYEGNNEG